MGQLKFEWIFEDGQFVGRRFVIDDAKTNVETVETVEDETSYPKAS